MKNKISSISIVVLALLTACTTPITNLTDVKITNQAKIQVKKTISGKAEFPVSNFGGLKTKATLEDIAPNATVSIIYPTDNPNFPNQTVATGLTNATGNFSINLDDEFAPVIGEIFTLEASKRRGAGGNASMTIRTFIKWNGTTWESITTPNIFINSKTTALAAMSGLMSTVVNSNDTIGKIAVVGSATNPNDVTHLGTVVIHASSINNVANLVEYALSKNYDPLQYLIYQDGFFTLKDPNNIVNEIKTIAGGGVSTNSGIQATDARLNGVSSIKLDSNGNLYIAESEIATIKRVDKNTGIITKINAPVNSFSDISFDSLGNLYISYLPDKTIKKIDKNTGTFISTIAGNNYPNPDGILATNAKIDLSFIFLDSIGNIYISYVNNHKIRKIDKNTGIISTFAGNDTGGFSGNGGVATNAQLNYPSVLTFDSLDNIYIADAGNNRIRKVDKITGIINTIAGNGTLGYSGDGGQATNASLNNPSGLTFDSFGNLYISDYGNNRIRKIDKNTQIITTIAGTGNYGYSGDGGQATNAQLNQPYRISCDSSGNIYITDYGNKRIRKVDKLTGIITTVAGNGIATYSGDGIVATNAQFSPLDIKFDSLDNIYIADYGNNRIRKVDKVTGIITTVAGNKEVDYIHGERSSYIGDNEQATDAKLNPSSIVFDSLGNMYIADIDRIRKVDKNTNIITTVAGGGVNDTAVATNAVLRQASKISFDSLDNLYISDIWSQRIRKVDKVTGIITTMVGKGGINPYALNFSGDGGQAKDAQINTPQNIRFDSIGNIYFIDLGNQRIRKVDKNTGIISTVAGNGIAGYSGDNGQASNAKLNNPSDLILDENDNLYIVEPNNNRIRKVDKATNSISTFYNINFTSNYKAYFGDIYTLYVVEKDSTNYNIIKKISITPKIKP